MPANLCGCAAGGRDLVLDDRGLRWTGLLDGRLDRRDAQVADLVAAAVRIVARHHVRLGLLDDLALLVRVVVLDERRVVQHRVGAPEELPGADLGFALHHGLLGEVLRGARGHEAEAPSEPTETDRRVDDDRSQSDDDRFARPHRLEVRTHVLNPPSCGRTRISPAIDNASTVGQKGYVALVRSLPACRVVW